MPVELETSRLRLRPLAPEDLAAVYAFHSRADTTRWLYWGPRDEDETRAALASLIAHPPEKGFTLGVEIKATGELIGHVNLSLGQDEHRHGEIGFILHPDHHGRGYATEAGAALLALAFERYDRHRVVGRIEARNDASARVLEKLGMRREAHLVENEWVKGEWQSEVVYALLAREWDRATFADLLEGGST